MPSDTLLLHWSLCACPPVGSIIAWRIYPNLRSPEPLTPGSFLCGPMYSPLYGWQTERGRGTRGEQRTDLLAGRGTLRFQRWRPRGDSFQRAHGCRVAPAVEDLAVKLQVHLGDPPPAVPPLDPRP